ncbi:MAG: sel1 repeat family protein [Gammaproteobacteria bacterium]|nr:sel1 repeat family protein [Gammaproteobacteria bacterium]
MGLTDARRAGGIALLMAGLLAAPVAPAADAVATAARILGGAATGERGAALATLEDAATQGDRRAARWLGDAYYAGRGVTADPATALTWWQRAATAGDVGAAFNAGLVLLRDPARQADGLALLGEAAAADDALACFALGTWHAREDAAARARPLLECAARQGYAPAQYNLAQLLARGEPPARAAAHAWFAAAAPSFAPAVAALAALPPAAPNPAPTIAAARHDDGDTTSAAPASTRDWVLAQSDDDYTIQVAAGRHGEALARLLREHAAAWPSAWFLHRPEAREPYSAVVGVFDSYGEAAATLAALPPALAGNAPWIRRFEVLKRELRAAAESVTDPTAAAP